MDLVVDLPLTRKSFFPRLVGFRQDRLTPHIVHTLRPLGATRNQQPGYQVLQRSPVTEDPDRDVDFSHKYVASYLITQTLVICHGINEC